MKDAVTASDFALELTLTEESSSKIADEDSLREILNDRWKHIGQEDREELFAYINFAYDIEKLEKQVRELIRLETHKAKVVAFIQKHPEQHAIPG